MGARLSRQAIIDAARELLAAEGIEAVSLRRVAGALGVTAPALYAHVNDKRDLLQGVADQEGRRVIERIQSIPGTDPLTLIRERSLAYVDYAKENPALFKAIFMVRPELTAEPQDTDSVATMATEAFEVGAAPFFELAKAGLLGNVDPHLARLAMWTAAHGVATVILAGPEFAPDLERALVETVIDAVIAGLTGQRPQSRP
ncbi:MAG TPA: TetR/AcrR family transcriptional regulator [Acidimicrobiales bacterium]|nr:TetR/AcrR family transcriptional regulator [Acidimicrobiales bacterium]